jgi:hypothetical protein
VWDADYSALDNNGRLGVGSELSHILKDTIPVPASPAESVHSKFWPASPASFRLPLCLEIKAATQLKINAPIIDAARHANVPCDLQRTINALKSMLGFPPEVCSNNVEIFW